jgi:hypothetical protein
VGDQSEIWISTNSGANWTSNSIAGTWNGVALSADSGKLFAANTSPGAIWTSQTTPMPQLNITPDFKISWLMPSTNFVLQQSSDLSNWIDVTDAPALNLCMLQDEIVLSPTNNSGFYRLESR